MKHKFFTLLLAVLASVATMNAEIYSGTCGENLLWSLNTVDSILIISGSGEMQDYSASGNSPWNTSYIKHIFLDDNITHIGNWAFQACHKLTSIDIPNSVISIGKGAFASCDNLTSIVIPNSVRNIAGGAFRNCSSLADVVIPNNVDSIGPWAFYECNNITSITIPENVTFVGELAFKSNNLQSIVWEARHCNDFIYGEESPFGDWETLPNITSLSLGPNVEYIPARFGRFRNITSINLPANLDSIGAEAFSGSAIDTLIIPNSVKSIGSYAFQYCSSLQSVTIGNGLTKIGEWAFNNCNNLTSVHISDLANWCAIKFEGSYSSSGNPLSLAQHLYLKNTEIHDLVIPEGVRKISRCSFYNCIGLTSVSFPESLKEIDDYSFSNCMGLTSLNIPDSITIIGQEAFYKCKNVSSVTIGEGLITLGARAFGLLSDSVNVSWNAISYGEYATSAIFSVNKTTITFGDKVEVIPAYMFINKTNLASISLPTSAQKIGKCAFFGCSSLTDIALQNVGVIGERAFAGCIGLRSVTFSASRISIGSSAFYNCNNLNKVYAPSVEAWCNIEFTDADANPLTKANVLYVDNKILRDLVIPSNAFSIKKYAFQDCSTLSSITIPGSVYSIRENAFYNCNGVSAIYNYASSPQTINSNTLYNVNRNFCTLYVPAKSLEKYQEADVWNTFSHIEVAPQRCGDNLTWEVVDDTLIISGHGDMWDYSSPWPTDIKAVVFPDSLTKIGAGIFYSCKDIESVTCYATVPPSGGSNCGLDKIYNINLLVPEESIETYSSTLWWQDFMGIYKIGYLPYEPFNLHAEPGPGKVTVSWEANENPDWYIITYYLNGKYYTNDGLSGENREATYTFHNDTAITLTWSIVALDENNEHVSRVTYGEAFTVQPSPYEPHNVHADANGDGTYTIRWTPGTSEEINYYQVYIYSSGYRIWDSYCLHPDSSIVTSVLPWAGNYSYQIIIFDTNQNILGYSRWNYLTVDPVEEHSITTRVLIQPSSGYNTDDGVTLYRCLSIYDTDTVTAIEEGNGWYSYTWITTDPGVEINMIASYWSGISVSSDTCLEYTKNLHLVSCDAQLMDYTPFNLHAEPGAGEVTLSWEAKDIANRYRVCLYEDGVESYSKWYNGDVNSITITLSNDLAKTYTWSVSPYVDGMGYLNAVYGEVFTVQPSPFIPQNLRVVANGDGTYTINWDSVENERVYRYLFQLDYPNDMGYYTEYTNTASFTTGILPVIGEYTYQVKCIDSEYSVLGVSSSNFIVEAPEESRDITIRLLIRPYSGYNTDNGVTFFLYSYLTSQWTAYEAISEGGYWYSYTINTNDIAIVLYFDEHYSTISGDTCLQYVNGDELMSVDCNTVVSNTTITVAQAIEIAQALEEGTQAEQQYAIIGYVSALAGQEDDFERYNNQTYWITDERGSTAASISEGAFSVFRGTASEKVQVGDKVSAYGVIRNYYGYLEMVRPIVTILEKNPIEEPAEVVQLPYSESFLGDMGLFTVHDVAHDTLPYVWLTTDLYGMKASGYRYGPHNTESWLVSPKISLPAAGNINMTFETCLNYASDDYNSCAVKILVDNTWSDLQFNKWPAGHSWVFDTVTTSLDAYAGNEIQIAFVYRSSTLYSNATWEVRNLEIKQIEEPIVYSPIQIGDLYYILDRENQTAVVTSKSFYQSDDLILVNEGWDIAEAVIPATVTYNDTVYEVTRIGWRAFFNCQNLTSVTIGDNVHVIDAQAFFYCINLQEVTISDGVDTIEYDAFQDCTSLSSIVIPAGVDTIGQRAFGGCKNLTSVTINSNAVVGKDFNSEYIPDLAYIFGWQVQEYIIGEGVTRIGYHAFNHFSQKISQAISHLTSITIPSTLTEIANEAFYNCVKLTSLTIPDGVATIGEDAFLNVRSVFYNGNATGAPWGALCLNSFCETEPEPEPEPIEPAVISVTDNSLEDWNDLPAAYVVEAVRPIDATYTGLKNVKVYATKSYINILVEPNMEDVTDLEWVPFHIFIDTDNSDLTGGYGDLFADANTDIMIEGALFADDEPVSYAPGVWKWWGEIGGDSFDYWTEPTVEHSADDCWGAIVCEGELAGCSSQYVDGKFEIQILRNNIPATWNDSVFGIGFEIEQEWISVGILPLTSPTDENPMGKTNKLKVRIHKANDPTEVEPIGASSHEGVTKFIHNGQIYIRRGDKIYTLTGQEVK